MCFVCCTRPIAAIALFTTGFRAFRMSARAKKRLWGGRPRPEPYHPITFFRLSRRHPPLPYSLPFNRSCSYRARTKSGVREPSIGWDPRRQSRPHPIEGTRDFSRLTEINPYSAPVIRGHMCFVCHKSRFSSCSPLAGGEQSEKTITDTPRLLAVFQASVVLAARKTKPLGSMINGRPKSGDMR